MLHIVSTTIVFKAVGLSVNVKQQLNYKVYATMLVNLLHNTEIYLCGYNCMTRTAKLFVCFSHNEKQKTRYHVVFYFFNSYFYR